MNEPRRPGKRVGELVVELATLVAEVRLRAQRARTDPVYVRYVGMRIPVDGPLLKALRAPGGGAE